MKRLIDWFRSWFIASDVSRQLSALNRRVSHVLLLCEASNKRLRLKVESLNKVNEGARQELREAEAVQRSLNEELESVRSQLNVAEKITIPALTRANKLLHERWGSQVAIESQRQTVIAMSNRGDIE